MDLSTGAIDSINVVLISSAFVISELIFRTPSSLSWSFSRRDRMSFVCTARPLATINLSQILTVRIRRKRRSCRAIPVFVSDRARVVGGASLAQSQLALANTLVQRAEFVARYPLSLDGRSFINAVLATLSDDSGVDLSAEGGALMATFNSGGRAAVMYRLADDNALTNTINNRAFIDAEYNRAFVFTQYAGYLRRDADLAGFLFWLGRVNSEPVRNVRTQHAMVCSFITSTEYQQRFSSVLSHSNAECP